MRMVVKVALAGLVTYAAYRAVRAFAPTRVSTFFVDLRAGMTEREAQLREALGLEAGITLTPEQARALVDDPAGRATARAAKG